MKTKHKNLWIVTDPSGHPFLHTLEYTRKDSIRAFMKNDEYSDWPDWKEAGWSVNKVDVEFTPKRLTT